MFLDLHNAVTHSEPLNGAHVVAVGGFPIVEGQWCGAPVSVERVRAEIRRGLGLSAVLTHRNKSGLSLGRLAEVCVSRGHLWAYRWITLSVLFAGYGVDAELAFSRDTRFFMSWPVSGPLGSLFVANGSLKDWVRFTERHESPDWSVSARKAMSDSGKLIGKLL